MIVRRTLTLKLFSRIVTINIVSEKVTDNIALFDMLAREQVQMVTMCIRFSHFTVEKS